MAGKPPPTTLPLLWLFCILAVIMSSLFISAPPESSTTDINDGTTTKGKIHKEHYDSTSSSSSSSSTCNDDNDSGIQVINAILTNMWPSLMDDIITNIQINPIFADPYYITIPSSLPSNKKKKKKVGSSYSNGSAAGKFRNAPTLFNITMLPSTTEEEEEEDEFMDNTTTTTIKSSSSSSSSYLYPSPKPVHFQCGISYQGRPGIDLVLIGAQGYVNTTVSPIKRFFKRVVRNVVPDVTVTIKSLKLYAYLNIELDMHTKTINYYFLETTNPTPMNIEWDLEFTVTKANIPLIGEDQLDTILTNAMIQHIDIDHPIHIKF